MKKFWKVLGVAALAAVLTPHSVTEDVTTGEREVKAVLWSLRSRPTGDGKREYTVTFGPGRGESGLFDDESMDGGFAVEAAGDASAQAAEKWPEAPAAPEEPEAPAAPEAPAGDGSPEWENN